MTQPAKHTPGPWEVNKSDVCIIEIAKPLGVGCVLPIADVQYNPSRENPGQHMANAHLIAAAPAMYEALLAIMDCVDLDNKHHHYGTALRKGYEQAKAALVQAEARS